MNPAYRQVIHCNGLSMHLVHKNAHSAIVQTFKGLDTEPRSFPWDSPEGYRFMVIRNPLDKLVSCWSYFCKRPQVREMIEYMAKVGYKLNMTFEAFLEVVLRRYAENWHTEKQVVFTGGFTMDELCPLEKLNDRWPRLAERFGLGQLPERYNPSAHNKWDEYYTTETKESVEKVFKEDVELYKQSINDYRGN